MPLVPIHATLDIVEALVMRSTLEAYGIPAALAGLDLAYQFGSVGSFDGVRILVSDCDAQAAIVLLKPPPVET